MLIYFQAQNITMNHEGIKKLAASGTHFDVAIMSPMATDVGLYLAKEIFKSPIMVYSFIQKWPLLDVAMGNPVHPAYNQNDLMDFK